jgi:hypothetical protein
MTGRRTRTGELLIMSLQSTRIDWNSVVDRVKRELPWFQQRDITPTLRTLFYRLVSLEIIPNTEQKYKQLSNACVKAREDGKIPWDAFADEGRLVLEDFVHVEDYQTPEQYVRSNVDFFKNASTNYVIPKWYKQPNYVPSRHILFLPGRSRCEDSSEPWVFGLVLSRQKLYETSRNEGNWKRNSRTVLRRFRSFG